MHTTVSADTPAYAGLSERLRRELGGASASASIFTLIDGARVAGLPLLLKEFGAEPTNLFREAPEGELTRVAPYLAPCDPDGEVPDLFAVLPEILDATIFLVARTDLEAVRRHLRRFLVVRDAQGLRRYFRFYDPRVLKSFVAASSPRERHQLRGPMERWIVHEEGPQDGSAPLLRVVEGLDAADEPSNPPPRPAPDARNPFQLRAEHEAAFQDAVFERYTQRCVAYLRVVCAPRLRTETDDDLRGYVTAAIDLGEKLGLDAGADVTRIAVLLVYQGREATERALSEARETERRRTLHDLYQRAFK